MYFFLSPWACLDLLVDASISLSPPRRWTGMPWILRRQSSRRPAPAPATPAAPSKEALAAWRDWAQALRAPDSIYGLVRTLASFYFDWLCQAKGVGFLAAELPCVLGRVFMQQRWGLPECRLRLCATLHQLHLLPGDPTCSLWDQCASMLQDAAQGAEAQWEQDARPAAALETWLHEATELYGPLVRLESARWPLAVIMSAIVNWHIQVAVVAAHGNSHRTHSHIHLLLSQQTLLWEKLVWGCRPIEEWGPWLADWAAAQTNLHCYGHEQAVARPSVGRRRDAESPPAAAFSSGLDSLLCLRVFCYLFLPSLAAHHLGSNAGERLLQHCLRSEGGAKRLYSLGAEHEKLPGELLGALLLQDLLAGGGGPPAGACMYQRLDDIFRRWWRAHAPTPPPSTTLQPRPLPPHPTHSRTARWRLGGGPGGGDKGRGRAGRRDRAGGGGKTGGREEGGGGPKVTPSSSV